MPRIVFDYRVDVVSEAWCRNCAALGKNGNKRDGELSSGREKTLGWYTITSGWKKRGIDSRKKIRGCARSWNLRNGRRAAKLLRSRGEKRRANPNALGVSLVRPMALIASGLFRMR